MRISKNSKNEIQGIRSRLKKKRVDWSLQKINGNNNGSLHSRSGVIATPRPNPAPSAPHAAARHGEEVEGVGHAVAAGHHRKKGADHRPCRMGIRVRLWKVTREREAWGWRWDWVNVGREKVGHRVNGVSFVRCAK
jgi:hypothetical protein